MNSTAAITTWTIDMDADHTTTPVPVGLTSRAWGELIAGIATTRAMGSRQATVVVTDADGVERTYVATRDQDAQWAVELTADRIVRACTCAEEHGRSRPVPGQGIWYCDNCGKPARDQRAARHGAVHGAVAKVARPRMEGHYDRVVDVHSVRMFGQLLEAAETLESRRGPSYYNLVKVARKVATAKAAVPQYEEARAKAEADGRDAELVETFTTGRLLALHAAADYARAVTIMLGGDDAKLAPVDMEAVATYLVMLADARGF